MHVQVVEMVSGSSVVGSIVILLMNAAEPGEQGRVQGLAGAVQDRWWVINVEAFLKIYIFLLSPSPLHHAGGIASIFMTIGPAVGGALWSLTFTAAAEDAGWPLAHIPFGFVGTLGAPHRVGRPNDTVGHLRHMRVPSGLIMVYMGFQLPRRLEVPKDERVGRRLA